MGTFIDLSAPLQQKPNEEEEFLHSHYDTEIIHLQSYDNFYSLMDRLQQRDASGESSRRLLLIWPVRGRILDTPMDFGRLRGWAVRNGYEIALAIPGNTVKLSMAREQGLPSFRSIGEAEKEKWQFPAKPFTIDEETDRIRRLALLKKDVENAEPPRTPLGIRLFLFLLTLAVLSGTAYAVLPQARVEISPYLTQKSINMTIWTDDRLDAPTLAGGIPLVEKKLELTLSASVPSTGQVRTEPGIAIGEIVVRNICDRIYYAASGSQVGTEEDIESGIGFITLENVSLDPGEERTVRIEAVNGGTEGNLPAGSIRYAAYPHSLCWEVRQEKPTEKGTSGIYYAPSDADRQAAEALINAQIQTAAAEALANDPDGKDLMPLGEAAVTAVKFVQYTPDTGYASDELSMRETLEVSYKAIRRSDMEAVIRGQASRMNMQIAGFTGYEILSGPKEENGLMSWSIRADYLVYEPQTNEEALQIMLRGKTIAQADSILGTLAHVRSYRITVLPSVLRRMPLTAQNIRVVIHPAVEAERTEEP